MNARKSRILTALLVLGACVSALAESPEQRAVPYPTAATPKAIDRGSLASQPDSAPISATVVMNLRDPDGAENLLKAINTPGDPEYHKFLSAEQFVARFAPTAAEVMKMGAVLSKYGLTVERTTATTLKVTGRPADMERAFSVSLHSYEIPAHDSLPGYSYHAPLAPATIPSEISASVSAVIGLDNRPSLYPHNKVAARPVAVKPTGSGGDAPGLWTVTDFANYYDVEPLYKQNVTGKGRTLGIITLASFTPSDAYAYWQAVGLNVEANRITIVNVDGGPGAPSDASGSIETTLDVEQSGGVAPGAKIIVYQAPNTNQSFVDAFAVAADSNSADTLSTSWGEWEWLDNLENSPVTDPLNGRTTSFLQAVHQLLLRSAIQGQSIFAAAGDGGAYDANDSLGCFPSTTPSCSEPLSVDYPASDTAITAGGGTTLAGVQEFCLNAACTPPYYDVDVPHERVWGWDYLQGLCDALGTPDPVACGIFPAGGGGGVSVSFGLPLYQFFEPGIQFSQPGQNFVYDGQLFYALPSYFPGRNVPDISFNADPDTGYVVYYTSSKSGFGVESGYGGTSFVAPQLNGVTALLGEYVQGRLGLLNFSLYGLGLTGQAYGGRDPAFNAIPYGDNWFYHGSDGYNPAVGLGTLNVANFAHKLGDLF
ncbi:MAG: S53 family peptidase [Terracidiphilus sp.]|jgi:subtilase family serine protease